jgi:integrase
MKNRGMGFCFQPTWKDKRTGEVKVANTWMISYSVHGQRHKESTGSTNKADAVRLLKQRITDAGNGKPVGSQLERTTLADILEILIDNYKANDRRSLKRARFAVDHLTDFFGANCRARDITSDRITSYQASRLAEDAARATINVECAMLRRAFRLAAKAGRVAGRPEFDMLQANNTRTGFFEVDQYHSVLSHLPDYLKPVITTAYITGWRTDSELLSRQWRHVDLERGWLRLDPGESKSKAPRAFPLTDELKAVLEAQRDHVRAIEHATGAIIPWIFIHPDGTRIKNFRGAWAKACRAAGAPGRLVHDFRRTAVRNLERAGVPRSAAMAMVGHKTASIYQRYAIVDSTMLQDAAAKLGAFHNADSKSQNSVKVAALPVKQ